MHFFTMPYLKPLVLLCLSAGCYASNVVPKHNINFENNNNEKEKTIYERMKVVKTEFDPSRHLSHDHSPIMVNNVSVSLSSTSVPQGGVIDITFTTTSDKVPSFDDFFMLVYDDIVFNTTDVSDWSSPNFDAVALWRLEKYNPTTEQYELLYNNITGVLKGYILPYYPVKLKAVIFTPGDSVSYGTANYILGVSQMFETIDSKVTINAAQKDRQVTFTYTGNAPIDSSYYYHAIILANETVPPRFNITRFYEFEPIFNFSSFPVDTNGKTVATFGGSDKNWPKGEYKLITWVYSILLDSEERNHIAVSNTIVVKSTICKQSKEICKLDSDCCGGNEGYLICKKFKRGLFGRRTVKQCAKNS